MIDKVATGSTADISDPNTSASIGDDESMFTRSVSPTKYTKNPTIKVEMIVPKTAYNDIVQKLAKKFDYNMSMAHEVCHISKTMSIN